MKLNEVFDGKRILIFGYGREGKSTENYIRSHSLPASLETFEGDINDIDEDKYDLIMKSPGIAMLERRPKYTSETELFLDAFGKQVIGVTGTKGKSTTASFIYEGLKAVGRKVLLLGNIGLPCFDYVDQIDDETLIVFELSCHQLLHINKAPHIAVFLNIYSEHLDYYGTMEQYFDAKANIVRHQEKNDFAFIGETVKPMLGKVKAKVHVVDKYDEKLSLSVNGTHNKINAAFARRVFETVGVNADAAMKGVCGFTGLSHRLQLIGENEGVRYYDDSISTIPEACIAACESISDVSVVLVGGMDRGIDYSKLAEYIRSHGDICFVLMYESGNRIYEYVTDCENVIPVKDLQAAVGVAVHKATRGSAVVLSPAAASYGYFKNFEERGDVFKELVFGEQQ